MNAYQLYVSGRMLCFRLGVDNFETAEVYAATQGVRCPHLVSNTGLSKREQHKYELMRKYLGC